MGFLRKLFGNNEKDKKQQPTTPRPKFVPPPPPEPPTDDVVTMAYVHQMLDEIRKHPQHTQEPRWAYIFDYFYDGASDAERKELIQTVSTDEVLWQKSPHVRRQSMETQRKFNIHVMRRTLVSLVLDDGHFSPSTCKIPQMIERQRNLANHKDIGDEFEKLLQEIASMATPRMHKVLLTGHVEPTQFSDLGVEHCDNIPSEALANIKDKTIRELFKPLRVAYRKSDAWMTLATFWREQANQAQRELITSIILSHKLYHVAKFPSDFDPPKTDPNAYVLFRLTLTAMQNAAPDWREEPLVLGKALSIAREHEIDVIAIYERLTPLSQESAQRVFKSLM